MSPNITEEGSGGIYLEPDVMYKGTFLEPINEEPGAYKETKVFNKDYSLDADKSFESFKENENNRRTLKTAEEFAVGKLYPIKLLYIHGETDTGKTHLLNAIGLKAYQDSPDLRIVKTTCDKMLNNTDVLYADLVLIDEIERVRGELQTQKLIARLIKRLLIDNKRIALAGRTSPEIMLSRDYDSDFIYEMRSGYSISTEFPFGSLNNYQQRTLIKDICDILDRYSYKGYFIEKDIVGIRYNIVIPFVRGHKLKINCNPNSEDIIIRMSISLSAQPMEDKRWRLLEACNVINWWIPYLSAWFFEDIDENSVVVKYEIPPNVGEAMESIITEVLMQFENYLYLDLIEKALNTDEDLYEYVQQSTDKYSQVSIEIMKNRKKV